MATVEAAGIDPHAGDATVRRAEDAWFDLHFAACRPEYEAILRSVGLQPGWQVLDAGCGSGAHLPLLADLVGPRGRIAACDLAPDTVATIGRRVATAGIVTPVAARVDSVTALPYADATFDAVWCANTSQYLADNELRAALGEFRRVVRPGGLVAFKESDRALTHFPTAPPLLVAHLFEAMARGGGVQAMGNLRGASLAGWLREAGMVGIRTRTALVERGAPLDEMTRRVAVPHTRGDSPRSGHRASRRR